MQLRVGGCTPACARDGLTGCRCRDRREQLGRLDDLNRGMVFLRSSRLLHPFSGESSPTSGWKPKVDLPTL